MRNTKHIRGRLNRKWAGVVAALVLISGVFLLNFQINRVNAADPKPYSDASPPIDMVYEGKVTWLYYGNIRIENKDGSKKWDYALNPGTGRYELAEAGYCNQADNKYNDYISIGTTGSLMRNVVLKPTGSQSLSCTNLSSSAFTPKKAERSKALFYQVQGDSNTVSMWNSAGEGGTGITFTKVPKANGWNQVYKRSGQEASVCPDIIAQRADNTWVFLPLTEWNSDTQENYGFIDGAKSEAASSILGSHTFEGCRVAAYEVINEFKTGIKNKEELGPAKDYTVNLSEKDGYDEPFQICGDEPGKYDGFYKEVLKAPEYSNIKDKVNKLKVKDGSGIIEDVHSDDGKDYNTLYEVDVDWGGNEPSNDDNWLTSCRRTDDPENDGNWAYHSLKIWETRSYNMTTSSRNVLIDLSHVSLFSYDYANYGVNDDGYKADGGVAQITADEVSGAKQNLEAEAPPEDEAAGEGEDEEVCTIEGGLGWILCPVLKTMANITDGMFGFLADNFLVIDAGTFSTSSEGGKATFAAWSRFRDLANAAFVIGFLIIIYSQITGAGISNYGIKKLLPKLILVAVLVNTSYWLCAIAIDASNILGYGLKSFISDIGDAPQIQDNIGGTQGFDWKSIVAIAVVGAIVWLNLAALIGFMALAAIVLVVICVILIIRKALVILLVALAPVALVCMLLPNTQQWFDRWKKIFITTLMIFPIIGLVFGASALASTILSATATDTLGKILAASVGILPLIVVPTLIKGSLSVLGGMGAAINNMGNKMGAKGSGLGNKAGAGIKGKASNAYKNSAFAMGRAQRKEGKENYRKRQYARALAGTDDSVIGRLRGRAARGLPGLTPGSRDARSRMTESAINTADKIDEQEVKGTESRLITEHGGNVQGLQAAFDAAVSSGDHVTARAAMNQLVRSGGGREALHNSINRHQADGTMGEGVQKALQDNLIANHGHLKGKDAALDRWGKMGNRETLQAATGDAGVYTGLSDSEMSGQSVETVLAAHASGGLDGTRARRILDSQAGDEINEDVRQALEAIDAGGPPVMPGGSAPRRDRNPTP